ncbi:MAG TPA: hypothetical protein VN922_19920, partial [Bacteroidia bacterium]|nr:hypothetical protein [Bacteroidia bacterium]
MRIRTSILFTLICFICFQGNAQSRLIDSLKNRLKNERQDTTKVILEIAIGRAYNMQGDYLQALDYGVRALNQ